ncbi:MAG: OB-fold nucleic acid binding domain-containing protein [Candidatus Aenigmatarchaeota archaeon]|jgi:RPA family protein
MKREPAIKVRIKDIVSGKFFQGNKDEMKPSFLITPLGQKISRVNVLATVTDKFLSEDESYISFVLDDGTSSIRAKGFREKVDYMKKIEIGDRVIVIGKLREWNGEIYINVEIIRKVDDPNYETYRKLEILKEIIPYKKMITELKNMRERMSEEEFINEAKKRFGLDEEIISFVLEKKVEEKKDYKSEIIKLLKELDTGEGVEIFKIFEIVTIPSQEVDSVLTELLNEGKIIEISPGRIKVIA